MAEDTHIALHYSTPDGKLHPTRKAAKLWLLREEHLEGLVPVLRTLLPEDKNLDEETLRVFAESLLSRPDSFTRELREVAKKALG